MLLVTYFNIFISNAHIFLLILRNGFFCEAEKLFLILYYIENIVFRKYLKKCAILCLNR